MAKGNDGNYLQHAIEVDVAARLAARGPGGIHVAFAHGMAPFEPTEQHQSPASRSRLLRALNDSYRAPVVGESRLVMAYRKANASLTRYPNSAELLRHAVGADRLAGAITEVDANKYEMLKQAWSGLGVTPVHSSWRSAMGPGQPLACPPELETPWLVTLDPMTYRKDGDVDDANLYRADLARLTSLVGPYVESGKPGVAVMFVYAIKPDDRCHFWQFADDLGCALDVQRICCWMTHRGGSRNLAGIFSVRLSYSVADLPEGVIPNED
jgi:hypothetical protein